MLPNRITETLEYSGLIKGPHEIRPYVLGDGDGLNITQWNLLTLLGWTVFTLRFDDPLLKNEHRWVRLDAQSGVERPNRMFFVERWARWLCGILEHHFEITGPVDIRHRLRSALRAAAVSEPVTPALKHSQMQVHSLETKLLTKGLEVVGTEMRVLDWRLNVFQRRYRRIDDPAYWGDLRPCGGLRNLVKSQRGGEQQCYQWKAGSHNIAVQSHDGFWIVRFRAHKVAFVWLILPWVSFGIALAGFVLAGGVAKLMNWWGGLLAVLTELR